MSQGTFGAEVLRVGQRTSVKQRNERTESQGTIPDIVLVLVDTNDFISSTSDASAGHL
jgi:hypothetical protein